MIVDFGYGVLVVSFLVALYSVIAAIYGELNKKPALVESARRAMLLTWPLLTLTAGILIYLLVNDRYEVQFVYEVTSRSMPTYLKVTAWWGGQAGSLLFWSWLMYAFASLVTLRKWDRDREFLPWVIVVACVTLAFFIGMNVFFGNPFLCYLQMLLKARNRPEQAQQLRDSITPAWPLTELILVFQQSLRLAREEFRLDLETRKLIDHALKVVKSWLRG